MRKTLAVAVVLAWGTASADQVDDDIAEVLASPPPAAAIPAPAAHDAADAPAGPPPPPPIEPLPALRWQRELHLRLGSAIVDGQSIDYKLGVVVAAGVRYERLQVLGEYAIAAVTYTGAYDATPGRGAVGTLPVADTDGILHRFGVAARYDFAHSATTLDAAGVQQDGGLWLEAGAGEEIYDWDKGGVLRRPDLELGIGLQGAMRTARRHRGGLDIGFHVQFAHRSDLAGTASTCSAPCTQATPPAAWGDRAFFLDLGFVLGG